MPEAPPSAASDAADDALSAALVRLLAPIAQLVVARGLPYAAVDEMLRRAVVAQAHAAHPGLPEHRRTSRISAATGLNRREVDRLLDVNAQAVRTGTQAPPRSPAATVFAHWRSNPAYRTRAGKPRVLPRTGEAPSFQALAQAVTRDVHPRALLEELLRLGVAAHDAERDTVALVQDDFVPRGDEQRMLHWLGANLGDHLAGAVANVTGAAPRHADQAIAADGLRAASVAQVRPLLHAHWQRMTEELVPLLQHLVDEDAARATDEDPAAYRVRFGLYGFDTTPVPAPADTAAPPKRPARNATKKKG